MIYDAFSTRAYLCIFMRRVGFHKHQSVSPKSQNPLETNRSIVSLKVRLHSDALLCNWDSLTCHNSLLRQFCLFYQVGEE